MVAHRCRVVGALAPTVKICGLPITSNCVRTVANSSRVIALKVIDVKSSSSSSSEVGIFKMPPKVVRCVDSQCRNPSGVLLGGATATRPSELQAANVSSQYLHWQGGGAWPCVCVMCVCVCACVW